MFQSSSNRHEQYLIRSANNSKYTLHKKQSSLESKLSSGADSGYNSSFSTTSQSIISSPISTVIDHGENKKTQIINKKKGYQQSPRQPDFVYSCPRPLAFPFHNDDHFLPVAEADPRDIARVTPSSFNRSFSSQSNTSVHHDGDSSYSKQSSILGSIQQGTVRSIRSIFQLPNSTTSISQHTQSTAYSSKQSQSLERLEIKKGTVQSLKELFTRRHQQQTVPKFVSPMNHGQTDNKTTNGNPCPQNKQSRTNASNSVSTKKSFSSRASEFASRAFRKKSASSDTKQSPPKSPHIPSTLAKPLPKQPSLSLLPEQPRKIKSEIKKLSARVILSLRPSKDNSGQTSSRKDDKKNPVVSSKALPNETSKVTKLWKSFRSLMTGKKSSRVGVL
ncbi:hypothetical protein G6F46_003848 [Rhizopus delemar]|uniref:Uncharacterized protein n=3 Tax=Rhizopus TaxID=4842 RepID=I1BMF6_RHIO9|nr:hypothetical protein RO3G_02090 [Rhizopus delemar RA 99-880]KAG1462978.1 hypothetical protein G6F55_002656 [Rhizopus delemar]KAG1553940.1 hypothetical protein G6F51_000272 [Rhizopus arrhizus]KAG1505632.1 hypothetical protein G6F54_000172 [Rhizopus delemar]KAG1514516.1 hypothetical protein G6F53_003618 [Rhizopus delemar]|eukprot:EIE77386.1 hypothetical protein RO3G_02090 [Rhizopus delemar RA 99-880]